MKVLGISFVWILLLGSLVAPIGFLSAFAAVGSFTTVTSSQNPSTFGQLVTFTAFVTPHNATGTIQFNDTSTSPPTVLGTGTLGSTGNATFSTSSLSIGSHSIVARYLGDVNNTSSISGILVQTVNPVSVSSTTTLISNVTSIISGKSVNFTAIVSPSSATGTIQFMLNGTNFGSPVTLSGGKATLVTSLLPAGIDNMGASYSGNSNLNHSISNSVKVTVATTVTTTVPGVTSGKVTGGGHIGKGVIFGFEVNADSNGKKKIKGNLEYADRNSKIKLRSNNMTSLSIDQNMTHASFSGRAKVNGTSGFTFTVSVTDPDKRGQHDTFSIMITDGTGKVIYQNSGLVRGHIEIHAIHKDNRHDVRQVHEKNDDENGKEKQRLLAKSNQDTNNLQGIIKQKIGKHD
ncbi:MAG: Ig-like domain repeat protein [Thaumarchaeota archaeon]|nr:Ig-like domain repeat protein [Nitrososphaerota archaeon]MBI3641584.1 Ig-like domain repeat protein [Nitrososphaerota archaeon]